MNRSELLHAEESGAASGWVSPLSQEDREYFAYLRRVFKRYNITRLRQHAWNMISLSAWRKASFICKKQTPDTVREGAGHGYNASPDRAA